MYDIHGSEEGFQHQFDPGNIDPNEIFRMFFQQAGGDPFANLFNGRGGGSFTVFSNVGGSQSFRAGGMGPNRRRQQQHQHSFGGNPGINIFDLLNGNMGNQGPTRRRQQRQHHDQDDDEDEINPFDIFLQQRHQRGRKNQERRERNNQEGGIVINLFNNCLP